MKALLVYPTHENGREVEEQYLAGGINAACYPARKTTDTKSTPQNCWNESANVAENIGFPVVKTVCPVCEHRKKCCNAGYLGQLMIVKHADVAICTHKRAEYSGLENLAKGCDYVSIHEDPVDLLRPKMTVEEIDLVQAQHVLYRVLNDPKFLDWFGNALRVDDDGNKYEDEELAVRKDRQYQFCRHLADIIDELLAQLCAAETTVEWKPNVVRKRPTGIERTLFFATRTAKVSFSGPAWRFILSAAAGDLHSAAIIVEHKFRKGGGKGVTFSQKSMIGVRNNVPPPTTVTWFNDATITTDRLAMIVNGHVQDETPQGTLTLQKKAVQILRDITRRTSKRIFANILRGVMADRPQFSRIGIICHRPHISVLKTLEPEFADRIAKSTYFGSGEDRSSNEWHHLCDLLVVAGTPRFPPGAIAEYLVQVGEVGAACHQPEWGAVYWHGAAESGEPVKVKAVGYPDEAWRRAHRDLVRAQIVQAIGRGRGILPNGCEVLVLSNEECGLVISDAGMEPLNGGSVKVLEALRRLTMENANKEYIGNSIVNTRQIAAATSLTPVRTRELLRGLERRGLVHKVGERSGWIPAAINSEESVSLVAKS